MSLPFLVPYCGFFALFGIVPLLCMDRIATLTGQRRVWIRHYTAFVLWNAFTTFWICNATVGGGIFAVLANAFQMSVIFAVFRLSRKVFKGVLPYLFLAFMWIAWERFYFDAEISWPWLVLGNSFARTVPAVQWYEYLGSLGGSLWVWACNLGLFGLMCALSDGSWQSFNRKAKFAALAACIVVLFGPIVLSECIYFSYKETDEPLEVLIVQPNFDPYQKFESLSQNQQNAIMLDQAERALKDRKNDSTVRAPLLMLTPETFTSDIVTNDVTASRTYRRFLDFLLDYPGVNILFGASAHTLTGSKEAPSYTARHIGGNSWRGVTVTGGELWIESHNSALIMDGTGRNQIFHKNKLVLGTEYMPYPRLMSKIDDRLGGVIGRCVGGGDINTLDCIFDPAAWQASDSVEAVDSAVAAAPAVIPLGCAICYESVFGEYCTGYVRKGAKAMTVITNDAWWGNTPGYRQHLSYASLRAIELRRDIARCANTGISAIINQRGDIVESTPWWEMAVLRGNINLNDKETFFVREGDIVGRVCTFFFLLLLLAMCVRLFIGWRNKTL